MNTLGVELELPREEHRERLLAALGNLIKRRGHETFVSEPILLPQARYFPERWEPTLRGARRLLRRLMHYAGLAELEVHLVGWRQSLRLSDQILPPSDKDHTAAWFAGIEGGVCSFGLALEGLHRQESLVATLAHEVAHAYRHHHGLIISDHDLEEKLTDLTAVYLGFGVFSLGASLSMETGGYAGGGQRLAFSRSSLGYLSPAEFALLLAAQLAVRGRADEFAAVKEVLSANHRALVARGFREFCDEIGALRALLSVPEPLSFPPLREVHELAELEDDDDDDDDEDDDDQQAVPVRDAGVAFRVRGSRASLLTVVGFVGTAVVASLLGLGGWTFVGLSVFGTASGLVVGRRLRTDECSGCRAQLPRALAECSGCGARIVGEIRSSDERLEAEERWHAENPEPAQNPEEEAEPETDLGAAMLVAWGLSRDLIAEGASSALYELAVRTKAGDFDTTRLSRAWNFEEELLTAEAMKFVDEYWLQNSAEFETDLGILGTANRLDDRPANYRRFSLILDGRFEAWKARA